MNYPTIIESFYDKERDKRDKPFLRQPIGDGWEEYTWGEVGEMARKLATGLRSLGLPPKSHIGLVSKNCREWVIADLAIMIAGYVSVPFYATLTGKQLAQVIGLGEVKALIVGKMEVWDDMKTGIPKGMPLITMPHYAGNSKITEGEQWDDFLAKFEPLQENYVPDMDDLWTIVFTSGTTGTPKGVMLTYRTLSATGDIIENNNTVGVSREGDNRFFSYLPLNHIAERVVVEASCLSNGGTISFVHSLDTFFDNLKAVEPTLFFAVPRIWTKFQLGILKKMPQKRLDFLLKIPIIGGMVKKKIKNGLGLGRCRGFLTGAAPMSAAQKKWYLKVGIPISEGYGMTENCAICTILEGDVDKPGSVGKPQYGVTLKIDPDTEEVLVKAPYVMKGYYKSPVKTAETLKNGWLHTGDQGYLDKDGYLYLTGRVKDTFKTAKGKFIVPAPIEWEFAYNSDIEQIAVTGLGLPQPIALVVPSELGLEKSKAALKESLLNTLLKVNAERPNYQKVSTVVVTKEVWNVENGLLTPTLKVKRPMLNKRYRSQYWAWHEDKEMVIFE